MRIARTRLLDMRMHRCMGVRGVDVAVRIAIYGLIVRMYRRRAVLERHLMLTANAMLQRPREHALNRECECDAPEQQ